MKMLGWITGSSSSEDSSGHISITSLGRQLIPVFSDYLSGKPSQVSYDDMPRPRTMPPASQNGGSLHELPREYAPKRPSLSLAAQNESPRSATKGGKQSSTEQKILLIDDEPDALLTYKSFLASEDYVVDAFEDPERAFMQFASMKPGYYDLIITDIRMQQMNGLVLYQRIKALDPSAQVIFVTALDAAEELVTILSPQPAVILRKPIERDVFNGCVRSIMSS